MKLYYLFGLVCLMSCVNKLQNTSIDKKENPTDSLPVADLVNDVANDDIEMQYADYFLVVVDKSKVYEDLSAMLFKVNADFNIEIDTLGRYFNKNKQQIMLPEDAEDEMYRGEYFLRRYESTSLSIENAYAYNENSLEPEKYPTEMILVAGMYATKQSADSLKNILLTKYPKTFVQKSKIYMGCMH